MKEAIRYEVECRFCAHHIGGDSAAEAADNIITHDIGHAFCGRCREVRVTVPDATICDDCFNDVTGHRYDDCQCAYCRPSVEA